MIFFARLICIFIFSLSVQASELLISSFTHPQQLEWEHTVFHNPTLYQLTHYQNQPAVMAHARQSASGLVLRQEIDLDKTPWLNWQWNIPQALPVMNEKQRDTDDFVARVYVIYTEGWHFWRQKTLTYVWSSSAQIGEHWTNPYNDNVHMLTVRSGNQDSNRWISEKRNIKQDFKKVFNLDIKMINAIAIMSDTDNTRQASLAYYGKLFFSDN